MTQTQVLLKNLLEVLEKISSFSLAESWDNVGLMAGNPEQTITGILVALDPTEDILDEALSQSINTVVTHHPLIFSPLKSVRTDQPIGRFLTKALKNNIAVVACHTNLDKAYGGVSDALALKLGLTDIRALTTATAEQNDDSSQPQPGFGRLGRFTPVLSSDIFVERLLAALNIATVRIAGNLPKEISSVAVCPGSGSDLAETAFRAGVQVYISGEIKLSIARWAEMSGFCVVDAGHFATENVIVPAFASVLQEALADRNFSVPVRPAVNQKNPFRNYTRIDKNVIIQ